MKLDRRSMLKAMGLGLGSALVPLVGGIGTSRGAPTKAPQRLLIVTTANGTVPEEFFPAAPGPLGTLSRILAPLDPYKAKMNVLHGIANRVCGDSGGNDGHSSYRSLLTAAPPLARGFDDPTAGAMSLDQIVAQEFAKGTTTRTPFDFLCVGALAGGRRVSWQGPDRPLQSDDDPYNVFARLFLDGDPQRAARLRRQRKSVLDASSARIGELAKRLGKDDRVKTDAHLDGIRELEKQLDASSCNAPAMPVQSDGTAYQWNQYPVLELQAKAQLDLLATAFACDLTRVAVFPYMVSGGEGVYQFLPNIHDTHHSLAHNSTNAAQPQQREDFVTCDTWHASMIRYVCDKLAAIPEGDGTVLDHTLVLWINEMDGASHTMTNLPIVLVGDAQGFLRTGLYVDYARPEQSDGRERSIDHHQLLLTIARAMGLNLSTFGAATQDNGNGHYAYVNDRMLDTIVA